MDYGTNSTSVQVTARLYLSFFRAASAGSDPAYHANIQPENNSPLHINNKVSQKAHTHAFHPLFNKSNRLKVVDLRRYERDNSLLDDNRKRIGIEGSYITLPETDHSTEYQFIEKLSMLGGTRYVSKNKTHIA